MKVPENTGALCLCIGQNRQRIAQEIASIHEAQSVVMDKGENDEKDIRRREFEALLSESVEFEPYMIRLDELPTGYRNMGDGCPGGVRDYR